VRVVLLGAGLAEEGTVRVVLLGAGEPACCILAVAQLSAPAYLYCRYIEALPPHALLERVGSRLERIAVPARVADVQPVMEALAALEELTAMGLGLRVEQRPGDVLLSAQEPETGGGDEFL
jgi:hypothetical protein